MAISIVFSVRAQQKRHRKKKWAKNTWAMCQRAHGWSGQSNPSIREPKTIYQTSLNGKARWDASVAGPSAISLYDPLMWLSIVFFELQRQRKKMTKKRKNYFQQIDTHQKLDEKNQFVQFNMRRLKEWLLSHGFFHISHLRLSTRRAIYNSLVAHIIGNIEKNICAKASRNCVRSPLDYFWVNGLDAIRSGESIMRLGRRGAAHTIHTFRISLASLKPPQQHNPSSRHLLNDIHFNFF